jgi:hypothetical protein
MTFHLFCFSIIAPFYFYFSLFFFSFLSLSFFEDPSFAGERFYSLDLSRRITW